MGPVSDLGMVDTVASTNQINLFFASPGGQQDWHLHHHISGLHLDQSSYA